MSDQTAPSRRRTPIRFGVQLDRMGRLIETALRKPVTNVQCFRDEIERTAPVAPSLARAAIPARI